MEVPEYIELKVGEPYRLELPGLGTAGYHWTYEVVENRSLIEVSVATTKPPQSSYEGNLPLVGASANEIFTLTARAVGHVSIRFTQRRVWEQSQPPLKEHLLKIDIPN